MTPTGQIDFVGDGTASDPNSRLHSTGALTLGDNLTIKKTDINADTTFSVNSANGDTIIGNDADNSGTAPEFTATLNPIALLLVL